MPRAPRSPLCPSPTALLVPRLLCLAMLPAVACRPSGRAQREAAPGAVVARVGDTTLTTGDVEKLLERSPFLRQRFGTPQQRHDLVDSQLVASELLYQEAVRQKLEDAPGVRERMRQAMISEVQRKFAEEQGKESAVSDADLRDFYTKHQSDYVRPVQLRAFRIVVPVKAGESPAQARARATALLRSIDQQERKGELSAFQQAAAKDDKTGNGGDLGFLTEEAMTKTYGPELARAAFALSTSGEKAGPVETPRGFELLKLQVKTTPYSQTFEQATPSLRSRIEGERRTRAVQEWMDRLRKQAKVEVNTDELAKMRVAPLTPQFPGPQFQAPQMPAPQRTSR